MVLDKDHRPTGGEKEPQKDTHRESGDQYGALATGAVDASTSASTWSGYVQQRHCPQDPRPSPEAVSTVA